MAKQTITPKPLVLRKSMYRSVKPVVMSKGYVNKQMVLAPDEKAAQRNRILEIRKAMPSTSYVNDPDLLKKA